MRLRNWVAVLISVLLLAGAGIIGFLVNRSALRAADDVHRSDSRALGVNNGILTSQLQLLSAAELNGVLTDHTLRLGKGDAADRKVLANLVARSATFGYGALLTDLSGNVLNATRTTGLPVSTDAGWAPLRKLLAAGQPGFSSIMTVGTVHLEAVAVPVVVGGTAKAMLIGLNNVAETSLQKYTSTLSTQGHLTMIVDSVGTIAATSDTTLLGTPINSEIQVVLATSPQGEFIEYTADDGTRMIAVAVGGLAGGWAYVRVQSKSSFDGAVHAKSQTLNLTLLAMLLIGVIAITILGYRTALQRRRSDERFQALFQHAPDLVAVLDLTGRIEYASPSTAAILGYQSDILIGTSVFDMVHPEDRPQMVQRFTALLGERGEVTRMERRVHSADGGYRWFEFTASNQMHNPALNGVVINARDVSENRAYQERLTYEAQHDALTGLPNRRRMQDALGASLRDAPVAVLFVDLDGFKPVNDVHGHEAGDELLRQVAARLTACVREGDVLARVGGDEFVILMPGVYDPSTVEATCDRIRLAAQAPFLVDGHEVRIGASVGMHLAPPAGNPDEALRAADHAMYAIKKSRDVQPRQAAAQGRHRAEP
jgi:diguanylate cyclase (GGDEF)-like protein/PAS domain S-box-containing protein